MFQILFKMEKKDMLKTLKPTTSYCHHSLPWQRRTHTRTKNLGQSCCGSSLMLECCNMLQPQAGR
jgi:hypothetical protein